MYATESTSDAILEGRSLTCRHSYKLLPHLLDIPQWLVNLFMFHLFWLIFRHGL